MNNNLLYTVQQIHVIGSFEFLTILKRMIQLYFKNKYNI